MLVVLTMAVGTALASTAVFGVSLALGAFVAGVVVSESPFSKQIGADLVPFQEAFAVIFFVSVGMLVNPRYLLDHWDQVAIVTLFIVVGKGIVSALVTVLLAKPVRAALVIGAGRSQIGEFSFIIGQTGMTLGLIDSAQYSLILAGAMVSITVNPLVLKLVPAFERVIQRYPRLWEAARSIRQQGPASSGGDDRSCRHHRGRPRGTAHRRGPRPAQDSPAGRRGRTGSARQASESWASRCCTATPPIPKS